MNQDSAREFVNLLFEAWGPFLVRYALRMTHSREQADDLVQDAFFALYRSLREGRAVADARGWTLGVVRNQIRKHARYRLQHAEELEPGDVLDLIPAQPSWPDIDAPENFGPLCLSLLSAREKEVLLLRLQSFKYREIAAQLGIGTKSVCTLLARAVRKLQSAPEAGRELAGAYRAEDPDAL